MRIAHYYADLFDTGGCPWNLRSLATAQLGLGHEVYGFGLENPRGNEPMPPGLEATAAPRTPMGVRRSSRAILELRPDVLQVWTALIPGNESVLRAAHRAKIPTVLTPQGHLEPFLFRWGRTTMRRLGKETYLHLGIKPMLRRWVDAVHAQSPYEGNLARGLGFPHAPHVFPLGCPVHEVPPGLSRPGPLRRAIGAADEEFLLGFFGRFDVVQKRFDTMFSALARCRDLAEAGRVRFVVAGKATPDERRATEDLISQHGLREHVSLAGPFDRVESFAALADLDVLLHATQYEGLPRVIREAASVGTPSIVSLEANAETLAEAGGAVLTETDVDALAASIRAAVEDPAWWRSARVAARAWAQENDWTGCARNFDRAYADALERRIAAAKR